MNGAFDERRGSGVGWECPRSQPTTGKSSASSFWYLAPLRCRGTIPMPTRSVQRASAAGYDTPSTRRRSTCQGSGRGAPSAGHHAGRRSRHFDRRLRRQLADVRVERPRVELLRDELVPARRAHHRRVRSGLTGEAHFERDPASEDEVAPAVGFRRTPSESRNTGVARGRRALFGGMGTTRHERAPPTPGVGV